MRNRYFRLFILLFVLAPGIILRAAPGDSTGSGAAGMVEMLAYLDSVDKALPYQTGSVKLREFATLQVPQGYKFLPEKDAQWLVEKVWGNPADEKVLGLLAKSDYSIGSSGWAFILSYDESGYVKDEDADDINYDDMLKEIQADETETNKQRTAAGYPAIHMVNWASKPFYDGSNKVLHWAKELQFGGDETPTLNYDVRILGRKGVLSMNAVGEMTHLADIKANIPNILHAASFAEGYQYKDFDPGVDKVAAYTVGGLVAGKLLAKAGLLALLLKNIKLVLLGIVALFAAFRKRVGRLFGRRSDESNDIVAEPHDAEPVTEEPAPALVPAIDPSSSNEPAGPAPRV
jgi:uncharacterized membrane-anchored protein